MTRIDEQSRSASFTRQREYRIGFHNCTCCGVESPAPSQAVLDDFAKRGFSGSTIWPASRPGREVDGYWHVPGWTHLDEYGDLCDACTRVVMNALSVRKFRTEPPPDFGVDFVLATSGIRDALQLATDGLAADFPPAPRLLNTPGMFAEARWGFPDLPRSSWTTPDYAKQGRFRHQISRIRNVLMGKPADDHGEE